jgi:hypothetical protein
LLRSILHVCAYVYIHTYIHTRICLTERLYMAEGLIKLTHILVRIQGVSLYSYLDEGFSRFCLVPPAIYRNSFIHQRLYSPLLGPDLFFSFVISFTETVGLLGRVISPSQGRYLHTEPTQTQNKHTDIHASSGKYVGIAQ